MCQILFLTIFFCIEKTSIILLWKYEYRLRKASKYADTSGIWCMLCFVQSIAKDLGSGRDFNHSTDGRK